jgi:hypothetical protein
MGQKKVMVAELFEVLDASLDEQEHDDLARRTPLIIDVIKAMVQASITPEEIAAHIIKKYPHMWIRSQTIKAAARYLERES